MTHVTDSPLAPVLAFGPFRLLAEQRQLLKGDAPVPLGSRARDILFKLLERPGQTIRKNELMSHVWPGVRVEEGTLRVHVSALRKALGVGPGERHYIENVCGLGYRFVGAIERRTESPSDRSRNGATLASGTYPLPLARMIGRDGVVETIARQLRDRRLLTLVGPGGIGKTTLAAAAMDQLRDRYPGGVRFVDFAVVADGTQVPTTLADTLRMSLSQTPCSPDDGEPLAGQPMLLVLDNCEHVIDAVAALAETLMASTSELYILATSREPLRAQGESVVRLPPLDAPPASLPVNKQEAMTYSAIQLFVQHATAHHHEFELTDANASATAEICRSLDGLPLAIELAAAHVGLFGLRGLIDHAHDLLDLLNQGRRTAPARQQTLRATLDWSFRLLSRAEQVALRRLCALPESFDLDAARGVVAQGDIGSADVLDLVSNLAAKSLIVAHSGETTTFRLFQTTRSYALKHAAVAE